MINNYVDKVFVVNLPHRTDRLEKFNQYAKNFGFEYEVFEAFNGKKMIDDNFEYDGIKIGQPYVNLNYFRGSLGCFISHLNLIKHCKNMNYNKVMIFEDDCGFVDDFNLKFENLMNNLKDWDFLYLSGSQPVFTEHYDGYSKISSILTTHSYLLNSKIYDIIIDDLTKNIFKKEVDSCYTGLHSKVNAYVSMPFITYQLDGYSDIGDVYNDYISIKKYL